MNEVIRYNNHNIKITRCLTPRRQRVYRVKIDNEVTTIGAYSHECALNRAKRVIDFLYTA